jgi:HYR domain-containing protein
MQDQSRRTHCVFLFGLVGALAAAAVPAASGRETGTLAAHAELRVTSQPASCPPGMPSDVSCAERKGNGVAPGLGQVAESYLYPVDQEATECGGAKRVLRTTARLTIVGKGELEVAMDDHPGCFPGEALSLSRTYRVTGGTGAYSGASGSGTVAHRVGFTSSGAAGSDTYDGTLDVPGLEFDLKAPVIDGAVNKTVRAPRLAKRVRVAYRVSARDDVDDAVAASCRPPSGSTFKLGRTLVRCSATDSSANTATSTFAITVKRRR